MARLLLVRHGATKLHAPDRFWGSTDVPLSDTGIRQAERVRDRLKSEDIKAVFSSSLRRARLTADVIAAARDLKVNVDPALNECNFGFVEGLTFTEISKKYPELAELLLGFDMNTSFPGGESLTDFDARVQEFLPALDRFQSRDTVLIVAHGGTLPLLACHLLGLPSKTWRQLRISQGSLSIVETFPQGAVLTLLNDTSHLTGKGK